MVLIRAERKEAFDHAMLLFDTQENSPLERSLTQAGFGGNITAFLAISNQDIELLTYNKSDTEKDIPIIRGDMGLVRALLQYRMDRI